MAQVITIAGERLFALKAQNNEQLDIDTFIFSNVPGQDPNATIDRNEGLPPVAQRVHQQIVQQVGRINDNVVVYSTVLDSVTGPFDFNWVGLYSSANQTLIAVSHIPNVSKTITVPGTAGNTLNRNFGIEYSGIADLAGITVQPETWQLDFTARLSGMDELTRQLAADMNGKDWFIDDGFKVVPRSTTNTFKVTPGAGYVSGLRVELKQDHILTLQYYPQFVYVDVWFDGDASSKWAPKTAFTVTNGEMDDYIDVNGKQHYVFKLARITAADVVEDLRNTNGLRQEIDTHINKQAGAHKVSSIEFDKRFDVGNRGAETNSSDPMINVNRNVNDEISGNGHCFSDSSLVNRAGDISYACYDARIIVEGENNYGHFAPFQNGMLYDSVGTLSIMYGYVDVPVINNGVVVKRYGAYIGDVPRNNDAELTANYGIWIAEQTSDGGQAWAIVTKGSSKSLFEGKIIAQGGLSASDKIDAPSGQIFGNFVIDQKATVGSLTSLVGGEWALEGSSSVGLRVAVGVGSTSDFALMTQDLSQFIMTVPTGTKNIKYHGSVGFNGATPIAKPSITGSRGGNIAIASLLTSLSNMGLISDNTTA